MLVDAPMICILQRRASSAPACSVYPGRSSQWELGAKYPSCVFRHPNIPLLNFRLYLPFITCNNHQSTKAGLLRHTILSMATFFSPARPIYYLRIFSLSTCNNHQSTRAGLLRCAILSIATFFSSLPAHPIYYLRTFFFSFPPPKCNSDPRSLCKALLPPPHYGTAFIFIARILQSHVFPRRIASNCAYPRCKALSAVASFFFRFLDVLLLLCRMALYTITMLLFASSRLLGDGGRLRRVIVP